MGRLMDEDIVIQTLKETGIIQDNDLGHLVLDEIGRMPTAYNPEKVVAELEVQKNKRIQSILLNSQSDFIDQEITSEEKRFDVIKEIVRKGGVE